MVIQMQIQQLQIAGLTCSLYLPPGYDKSTEHYPVIYVNGEIPINDVLTDLVKKNIQTDFLLLSIRPESWNDDFTPWCAPAFREGEAAPQGKADVYLAKLAGEIKPYIDANYRTKPEPERTALFGYSLGGLTAVYALYRTDIFGAVGSLSGSLWYDDFCEFMEKEQPLRSDVKVYLSLGKKESASRNPRMGKVAECTERVREILSCPLDAGNTAGVYFEWNDGGHFHGIEKRFAKAISWWAGIDGKVETD